MIFFYRIVDPPILGFFTGSFVLAFICVILGEFSVSFAIKINRSHIDKLNDEMREKERLSMMAYNAGDKGSYDALNKEATDAWGKHFFTMAAYFGRDSMADSDGVGLDADAVCGCPVRPGPSIISYFRKDGRLYLFLHSHLYPLSNPLQVFASVAALFSKCPQYA